MISFSSKQSIKGYTSSPSTHPSNILLRSSSVSYDQVLKFTNFCFDSFPKQCIGRCYLHLWWYFLFRKLVPKPKLWNMSSVMFFFHYRVQVLNHLVFRPGLLCSREDRCERGCNWPGQTDPRTPLVTACRHLATQCGASIVMQCVWDIMTTSRWTLELYHSGVLY